LKGTPVAKDMFDCTHSIACSFEHFKLAMAYIEII